MAAHQNADKIIGLAAYMFSEQGQMQDIYFTRQLTGEEMQTRMKDEVTSNDDLFGAYLLWLLATPFRNSSSVPWITLLALCQV